uniref:Uncharacterized protein n=1 Tax=Anguilla anguilla TaxID=7936 RepID=A0A0E9T0N6_ANGAN
MYFIFSTFFFLVDL